MAPILPLQLRAARHSMAARPPAAAGPTSSKVVRSLLFPFSHTGCHRSDSPRISVAVMLLCLLEVLVFSNFSLLDAPDLMESTGPDQTVLQERVAASIDTFKLAAPLSAGEPKMSLPAHACSRPSASPSVAAAGAVGMWTTADIGVSIDRSLGAQFAARISALQLHKTEIDPQSLAAATLLILLFHRLLGAGSGGAQKKSQVGGGLQPSAARLALGLALVAAQLCGAAADGGGGGGGWRGGNATSAVLRWSEQKLFGAYSTAQATAVGNVSPAFENNKLFSICLALAVLAPLYLGYSLLTAPKNPPPQVRNLIWRGLKGELKLEQFGAVEALRQCRAEHGDIFRIKIGPLVSATFLIGPEACDVWFKQKNTVFNPGGAYRKFMKPVFGPRVVYDAPWERMASQLAFVKHGLSNEMMRSHPAKLQREVVEFCIEKLPQGQGPGAAGTVELYHMTSDMIIRTASRCLLGDEVREQVHTEFAKWYFDLEKGISHLSFLCPWAPTAAHRSRDRARSELSKLFTPIIRSRRELSAALAKNPSSSSSSSSDGPAAAGREKPNDFLQILVDGQYRDGSRPDDEAVVGLMVAALFGGQHTSNITVSWLLMMIHAPGTKQSLLPRLLAEQKEVLARHGGKMCYEALMEMQLLENCIKETLRMFPPLVVLMRKVLEASVSYKGYTIPKGDLVCISAAVQNRLPELFDEPDSFNPDRFNKMDGDQGAETRFAGHMLVDKASKWIPFGGGRHACVGRYFAFLQIKSVVSILIRHYDIEYADKSWQPTVDYSGIVAVCPPCPVKMTKRVPGETHFPLF